MKVASRSRIRIIYNLTSKFETRLGMGKTYAVIIFMENASQSEDSDLFIISKLFSKDILFMFSCTLGGMQLL